MQRYSRLSDRTFQRLVFLLLSDRSLRSSVKLGEAAENMLKTTVLLSTAFCILTIPCTIWYLLFELNVKGFSLDSAFYHLSVVAIFCNCCINPLLYTFKYKEFKDAAKMLICKDKGRNDFNINSISTTVSSTT